MGLFGDKTSMAGQAQPARLAPGDEVRGRITVGEPNKKAQDGRVFLLYVNTCEYETTDSDGDTTVSTANEEVVVAQGPLAGAGGPVAGRFDVAFRVPEDAPPSARETVEWKLEAILDRPGGRVCRRPTRSRSTYRTGPPTFTAEHNALEWAVEVSVDRRMRRDPTPRLPVVVRSER